MAIIICSVIIGLLAAIGIIYLVTFDFDPQDTQSSFPVFSYDTVYIPLPSQSQLIEKLSLKTNGTCTGTLYQIPCEELHPYYNQSYIPEGYTIDNHIYCLNGSKFIFNMRPGLNRTDEVWISNQYYFANFYRAKIVDHTLNCDSANKPKGSQCVKIVNGTGSFTVSLPSRIGQYFYVLRNASSVYKFHVSRYYYDVSNCTNCTQVGPVNSTKSVEVILEKNFAPTDIEPPNICLLMKVSNLCTYNAHSYVTVVSEKRIDFLIWFIFLPAIITVIVAIVIVVHICVYRYRMRCYNESL